MIEHDVPWTLQLHEYMWQIKNERLPITFYRPTGLGAQTSNMGWKAFCSRTRRRYNILWDQRESKWPTQIPNMLNGCTFTDLIDWTNKWQFWILKGCGCSVLGDRFPLDRPSFVFFFLLSFPLSSFLLPSLSFLFPQLLSFYQTPSGIWALLTRSAKSSRHYN